MYDDYRHKFEQILPHTLFAHLPPASKATIQRIAFDYRFTQQELRQVAEIALDLHMWGEVGLERAAQGTSGQTPAGDDKKRWLQQLRHRWQTLRSDPNRYPAGVPIAESKVATIQVKTGSKRKLGLGYCPVASPRTRCCNLLTLDAVDNCGYGCSYCSIQSFFGDNQVSFDLDFAQKLSSIEIDPERIYHIGTGQSSDSLMWGNSHGLLDTLCAFARAHPNVILELKTKSANVGHLLRHPPPPNVICTWSLNPQVIIDHEEHGTAALEKRLQAAASLADQGHVVGFHCHPMIHYESWQTDYGALFDRLQSMFDPAQVAMLSLGTLTFIKPVMRKIRERGGPSQILKLPLVEADGKLSYPDEIKQALFAFAYDSFSAEWKERVFFYLCMENQRFWQPVFGFDYPSNEAFELAMKRSYLKKIRRAQASSNRCTGRAGEFRHQKPVKICCRRN